jgi:putative transposase
MITGATLHKKHYLTDARRLDAFQTLLFDLARHFAWDLQSWSIFSNHYHFVAHATERSHEMATFLNKLHSEGTKDLNRLDGTPGRKAWFQYWDTNLTYDRSYFARLRYVLNNPVHHRLTNSPEEYPWCSAKWLRETATPSFYETVIAFPIDRVKVIDDF